MLSVLSSFKPVIALWIPSFLTIHSNPIRPCIILGFFSEISFHFLYNFAPNKPQTAAKASITVQQFNFITLSVRFMDFYDDSFQFLFSSATGSVHIHHRIEKQNRYRVGKGGRMRIEWGSPKRIIDLWQHVCRHCQDKVAARAAYCVVCVWAGTGRHRQTLGTRRDNYKARCAKQ